MIGVETINEYRIHRPNNSSILSITIDPFSGQNYNKLVKSYHVFQFYFSHRIQAEK